jgi:hypothetical protein
MGAIGLELPEEEMVRRGLRGSTTYVVIQLDEPSPQWVPAAHAALTTSTVPNDSGLHTARVHFIPAQQGGPHQGASFADARVEFAERFGIELDALVSVTYGEAIGTLAALLGFRSSEVIYAYAE